MSFLQSASAVRIERSNLTNIGGDQTNFGGDQIIHNSNNGTSQTTPTPFIIVRTYVSFWIDQLLCSTS